MEDDHTKDLRMLDEVIEMSKTVAQHVANQMAEAHAAQQQSGKPPSRANRDLARSLAHAVKTVRDTMAFRARLARQHEQGMQRQRAQVAAQTVLERRQRIACALQGGPGTPIGSDQIH